MSVPVRYDAGIDHFFYGTVSFLGTTNYKAGSIRNVDVNAAAAIDASKLEGEYTFDVSQTGTVVAGTHYFGPIRGATGDVISIEAAITETIATGADRTVTIDLLKSTGAGAFASILTAVLVLDNTNVLRTLEAGSLAAGAALVDGDLLKLTIAVAGAAGAQALGLIVRVILREDA